MQFLVHSMVIAGSAVNGSLELYQLSWAIFLSRPLQMVKIRIWIPVCFWGCQIAWINNGGGAGGQWNAHHSR